MIQTLSRKYLHLDLFITLSATVLFLCEVTKKNVIYVPVK